MEVNKIVKKPRDVKANFHVELAQSWRRYGEPKLLHSPLVYSAFEFRLCIEKIVFELYYLMVTENLLEGETLSDEEL